MSISSENSKNSSDSNDSSSYASLDSQLDIILATYQIVRKDESATEHGAYPDGTIKIALAEPTDEEAEVAIAGFPLIERSTDTVPCIAEFTHGDWSCKFLCIHKPASNTFSDFVLDEINELMKHDTESQKLYPPGDWHETPYSFERGPQVTDPRGRGEHGHELLKFEGIRRNTGSAPVTITLWFKREIKDEGRGEDELNNEEIDRLNMKG
ncbi:hypothetical protein G7Y79_00047g082820 [Physcia stellaris]|nr:hypothetical protein G7Y79_00047g082820 [Physcia stellaris]